MSDKTLWLIRYVVAMTPDGAIESTVGVWAHEPDAALARFRRDQEYCSTRVSSIERSNIEAILEVE